MNLIKNYFKKTITNFGSNNNRTGKKASKNIYYGETKNKTINR